MYRPAPVAVIGDAPVGVADVGRLAYHGGVITGRTLAAILALGLLGGCGSPETAPEPVPEPVAVGPSRDQPELGRPRPKLLPPEAQAGERE